MFAARDIVAGEVIEVCPVLLVPSHQRTMLDQTSLYDYYFEWARGDAALALGCGSLYNHAEHPNAEWEKDFVSRTVTYRALETISAGTEIRVRYGNAEDLWFTPVVEA